MMYQKRLLDVRQALAKQHIKTFWLSGLNTFLQKPYKPNERLLEWVSGFEGSAGSLLITEQKAILLTDKRYVEQARHTLDSKIFSVVDSGEVKLENLLLDYLGPSVSLGFDPWCLSAKSLEQLQLASPHRKLVPLKQSLAETLSFADTFEESTQNFFLFNRSEHLVQSALSAIQQTLETREAFFCGDCCSLSWLLGLRGQTDSFTPSIEGYGLITKGSLFFWCHKKLVTQEVRSHLEPHVSILDLKDFKESFLAASKGLKVLFEPSTTPYAVLAELMREKRTTAAVTSPIVPLQIIKGPKELAYLKKAQIKEGIAWAHLLYSIEEAVAAGDSLSEWDVSERLERIRKNDPGYRGPSFETIAAFGANAAFMHYHPSPEKATALANNDLFLLDAGGQYMPGATTDTTRTILLGKMRDERFARFYTAVLKGFIAYSTLVFPKGARGIHLESAARRFLWDEGADFKHATGHGVGSFLNVHEPPILSMRDDKIALKPGMTVTCEPGYYKQGAFGIRLENMMTVIKTRHADFYTFQQETLIPFDHQLIDLKQLTSAEIQFIDTYHRHVFQTLFPLLTNEHVQEWLRHKTRPLAS